MSHLEGTKKTCYKQYINKQNCICRTFIQVEGEGNNNNSKLFYLISAKDIYPPTKTAAVKL